MGGCGRLALPGSPRSAAAGEGGGSLAVAALLGAAGAGRSEEDGRCGAVRSSPVRRARLLPPGARCLRLLAWRGAGGSGSALPPAPPRAPLLQAVALGLNSRNAPAVAKSCVSAVAELPQRFAFQVSVRRGAQSAGGVGRVSFQGKTLPPSSRASVAAFL